MRAPTGPAGTLRYPGATTFPGIVLEGGNPAVGPWAPPGRYRAQLTVGGMTREVTFDVHPDPRLGDISAAAFTDQFRLAMAIRDAESRANTSVLMAWDLRAQIDAIVAESDDAGLRDEASGFAAGIEAVAGELYQLRNQSPKDKIAFPIKLNDRLTGPPGAGRRHTDRRIPGGFQRTVGGARRAAADPRADAQRRPARLEPTARGSGAPADRGQGGALLIADG